MTEQEKKDITLIDKGIYDNPLLYNPLATLPDERRTAEVCRLAVQKSAFSIQFVPEALKTPELCLAAVSRRGETLNYVPEEKKTLELCQAAIRSNGQALAFVPGALRTPELCMEAVCNRGWALEDVPEKVKTPQMCREALKRMQSADYMILADIPFAEVCLEGLQKFSGTLDQEFKIFAAIDPEIMTERLALEGVRMDASCLSLVPTKLRTESVCMVAVGKVGIMLYEVPEQMRTAKVCETAISSDYRAMEYVPDELRTQDLYEKALENNPLAIQYFKPEQLTHEVCQRALARADDLRVLHYIPFGDIHERTLDFYCTNYHKTREFLRCMNPKHMTVKLAEMIFEREPELISIIPDHCKDRELCETAVRYDGTYLKWIPDALKTPDLCREAIRHSPYAIEYIPDGIKSPELYMDLVRENPLNLKGIPRNERTYDLCREAFDNTYGKDKSDFSIFAALTEPSLVLQVLREHDDPKTIRFLMNLLHLNPRAVNEQVALEAVRKNGNVLDSVPSGAITPLVAEVAVKNAPDALQWVPPAIRTPDMYLYAAKNGGDPSVFVPDEIKNGDNLYSFAWRMEARLGQPLQYEDHKRLYAGEEIGTKNVRTAAGVMGLCTVRYDADKGRLYFRDHTSKQTARQGVKPVIKPKKTAKGPKL